MWAIYRLKGMPGAMETGELRGLRPGGRRTRPKQRGRTPVGQSPDAANPEGAEARRRRAREKCRRSIVPGAGGAPYEAEATRAGPDVQTQKAVGPPNARAGGEYVQGRGRRDVGAPILVC